MLAMLTIGANKMLPTDDQGGMRQLEDRAGTARESCVPWHASVLGLVDLCIGIPQLDCDVTLKLVLEADSLDTTDGFHHCRLSMGHMPDGTCTYAAAIGTE